MDENQPGPAETTPIETGDSRVAGEILRQADACPPGKSFSPEDVARALSQSPDFQRLLSAIRRAAQRLAREGLIDILRKGKPVDPGEMRGVIRLRKRRDLAASDESQDSDTPRNPDETTQPD